LQGEEEEGLRLFYIFYITKVFYISEDTERSTRNVISQMAEICSIILKSEICQELVWPTCALMKGTDLMHFKILLMKVSVDIYIKGLVHF